MGLTIAVASATLAEAKSLPVYANEPTMKDLRRVFAPRFSRGPLAAWLFHPDPRIVNGPFQIGDLELVPLPLPHGKSKLSVICFKQNGRKRLAYLSDCKEVHLTSEQIRGAEAVVLERSVATRIQLTCAWTRL